MNSSIIEKAEKSLAPQILALQKAAYVSEAELYADFSIPPLIQTLPSLEADFGTHTFYIATSESVLVGCVNVRIEGDIGYIGRLVVLPEFQKQGVGSALLAHVERVHANLDAFELFTGHKSERNIAFYQSRSYSEYRREAIHAGLTLVHMRKPSANRAAGVSAPTTPCTEASDRPLRTGHFTENGEACPRREGMPSLELSRGY